MNLGTEYLGLTLANPIVAAASPLSKDLDGMKRLEDAGVAAIVMFSLFEEQIEHETRALHHYMEYGTESFAEALTYFPEPERFHAGPDQYLELIRRAKESLRVPVIPSLNGISVGGWTEYAKLMEEAGADALELNIYLFATDPNQTGSQVEERYLEVVRAVRAEVRIPIAVKIGPYFSSIANMAKQLVEAGANALVLFNRFYQPDFDLERLEVEPRLILSSSHEMRLPMTWIAILYGRVPCDFALTTGVHSVSDVLKAIMAGANVVQLASNLLKLGPENVPRLLEGMTQWMQEMEYESLRQMRGSMSQQNIADPSAFERANYMKELQSYRPDPAGLGLR